MSLHGLPHEIAATVACLLSNDCLPSPYAVFLADHGTETAATTLLAAFSAFSSREMLYALLRKIYRPTARLRAVSSAFACAPWLLSWDELYDFVQSTFCNYHSRHYIFSHMFDPEAFHQERKLRSTSLDGETKRTAMQLALQQGNSMYAFVFPTNNTALNRDIKAVDAAFVPLFGCIFSDNEYAEKVIASAHRVIGQNPADTDNCVGFPYIGVRHANKTTGEFDVYFFDELELSTSTYAEFVHPIEGRLGQLRCAHLRVSGSSEMIDFRTFKRTRLLRWLACFRAHQRRTHVLRTKLCMCLKKRRAIKK